MLTALLLVLLVFIRLALTLAPLDALGWWSSKGAEEAAETVQQILVRDDGDDAPEPYEHYVVYLSGIGAIDGHSILPEELPLVEAHEDRRSRRPYLSPGHDRRPGRGAHRQAGADHSRVRIALPVVPERPTPRSLPRGGVREGSGWGSTGRRRRAD